MQVALHIIREEIFTLRQQAVPAAMRFVYARACLVLVLCYGRPSLVWAVLKLLQFVSLWHSRLLNTGVVAALTNLRPESQIARESESRLANPSINESIYPVVE